ncbi:RagB/SusD family nutrient uptake outer membrane protein [Membranihabitans maritimus]|uniref:RagB/SusD family nutrient uptake outer membrane protein n=1 Tax=Membranihabitans maritimus TaxID=2904244 RepID=UPI001F22DD90|nr:RagB/SusD family nutrient uptake outer membrane protein [Membranihabitans maritimus]
MKKIAYLLIAFSCMFSCTDEFLEKKPLDSISSSNFWQTPTDLELYVNQFYTLFPNETRNDRELLDGNSDNLVLDGFNPILAGTRVVPSSGGSWSSYYSTIRNLNYFFENYRLVPEPFEAIKQFVGEASFFRAYVYFNLVRDYGNVPWVNKVLQDDSEDLFIKRNSRNVVVDSIISDLDRAISYLGEKDAVSSSRLNKQIALLFKSRVCLFEGTWEKYHSNTEFGVSGGDGLKYLELARDASKQIIENELYEIYTSGNPELDYYRFFGQDDYGNNPEVMLWKKWDESLGLVRWSPSIWGNGMGITKGLIDAYLCKDGKPIGVSELYVNDENLLNAIKNRDPRLAQTIWIPGDPINIIGDGDTTHFEKADINQTGSYLCVTGYQLKKYSNAWGENLRQNYYQSEIGSVIFRFAEVLLNYAEARAELGEITQDDIDITINKIRQRVGMPKLILDNILEDPNWEFSSISPVLNEIRRERRVELAFEGLRLHDILRWRAHRLIKEKRPLGAKFVQEEYPEMEVGKNIYVNDNGYIDPYQVSLPEGYLFNEERDYLFPVPNIELTLNENYTQNPGW